MLLGCSGDMLNDKIEFNNDDWINGDIQTRGRMVDDIIQDSILIGKSKKEVLALLGSQHDTTGNFSYKVDIGLRTGPFGLGDIWSFNLNVHFDSTNNKAIEVSCND